MPLDQGKALFWVTPWPGRRTKFASFPRGLECSPILLVSFSSWVADLGHPGGLTEPDTSFGKPAAMQRDQDSLQLSVLSMCTVLVCILPWLGLLPGGGLDSARAGATVEQDWPWGRQTLSQGLVQLAGLGL